MRDNEKEDARKRGGGADKRGGAHSRYQFFRCGKIGGGRINDGGRSGGTLRYIQRKCRVEVTNVGLAHARPINKATQ